MIRDRNTPAEARSADIPKLHPGSLQSYFEAAMRKYEEDLRVESQRAARLSMAYIIHQRVDFPDMEMESVKDSNHSRSHNDDPYDFDDRDFRRPSVATAEAIPRSGITSHMLRLSTVNDLKEYNGRDRDEDRSRSCIGRVKSALWRDQTEDPEKCLIFSDLLTGPAQNGTAS